MRTTLPPVAYTENIVRQHYPPLEGFSHRFRPRTTVPPPRIDDADVGRSLASPNTPPQTSTTSGVCSPDGAFALRCDYRSPRRQSSFSALRSAPASKTDRDPPLGAIDEEILGFAYLDAPSDRRTANDISLASGSPPATIEPAGGVFPPQGINAAAPFAHKRDTVVPDAAWRGILNE